MSPLFPLYLAPYLIPLQSLYSPIPHHLASNSPVWINEPALRHLYIHPSISPFLLPPLFPFCFPLPLFLVSKGKLAASFSLPKGLFKLEMLQSPRSPSLLSLSPPYSLSYVFLSAGGDFHLSLQTASGVPSTPGNFVLQMGLVERGVWKESGNEEEEK